MECLSHFRRLRNINILGNSLDDSKVFDHYLKELKYLRTFNNQPLDKNSKGSKTEKKENNLKRPHTAIKEGIESETNKSKFVKKGEPSNIYDEKAKNLKKHLNEEESKETKIKKDKILKKTKNVESEAKSEKTPNILKNHKPNENINSSADLKLKRDPIQKIIKNKTNKPRKNDEKVSDLLSSGARKISQWDN